MTVNTKSLKHLAWLLLRDAPATPSDIAILLGIHVHNARAVLFNLKASGRATQMPERVRKDNRTGRQWEFLWRAA